MSLLQLTLTILGKQTWSQYLAHRNTVKSIDRQGENTALQIKQSQHEQQRTLESGFKSVGHKISSETERLTQKIENKLDEVVNEINFLNANVTLLLGENIWYQKAQLTVQGLLLKETMLPEPMRLARKLREKGVTYYQEALEYQESGDDDYKKKCFDDALTDFLEASKLDKDEFTVYPLIASIFLYEKQDLPEAARYYCEGAHYSRKRSPNFSAECHYYAGITFAVQQQYQDALKQFQESVKLKPDFYLSHFLCASVASMINDEKTAVDSLSTAIKGDSKYFAQSEDNPAFENTRSHIQALLNQFLQESEEDAKRKIQDAENALAVTEEVLERETEQLINLSNFKNSIKELQEKVRQKNYETNLSVINEAPNLLRNIINNAESFLETQINSKEGEIRKKDSEISKAMGRLHILRAKKQAIINNYQQPDGKGCLSCLSVFLGLIGFATLVIVGNIVFWSVWSGAYGSLYLLGFIPAAIYLYLLIFNRDAIYKRLEQLEYFRTVEKPTKEIQKQISQEAQKLKPIEQKLNKELGTLKAELKDLRAKNQRVHQFALEAKIRNPFDIPPYD